MISLVIGFAAGAGIVGALSTVKIANDQAEKNKLNASVFRLSSDLSVERETNGVYRSNIKACEDTINKLRGELYQSQSDNINATDELNVLREKVKRRGLILASLRRDVENLTKDLESSQHALAVNSGHKERFDSMIGALKDELLSTGTAREKIRIKKAFSSIFCENSVIDATALIGGQSTNDCAKSIQKTRENTNKPRLNDELNPDVLESQEMVAGMIAAIDGVVHKGEIQVTADAGFKKKKLGACNWMLQRHKDWTPGKQ